MIPEKTSGQQRIKARPVTAQPGLPGMAYPSAGPGMDLIGKPPPRHLRGARPEPTKGRRKSHA